MKWVQRTLDDDDNKLHHLSFASMKELIELRGNNERHLQDLHWTYGDAFKDHPATKQALERGEYLPIAKATAEEVQRNTSIGLYKELAKQKLLAKRITKYNSSDGEVDPERYRQGDQSYYRRTYRGKRCRQITIGINAWLSHQNTKEAYAKIAGTALGIVQALRSAGYSVSVQVCSYVKKYTGEHSVITIPLLSSMEQMTIGNVLRISPQGFSRDFLAFAEGINLKGNKKHITLDGQWGGSCQEPPKQICALTGTDILITQSWTNQKQELIIKNITDIIRQKIGP